MSKNDKEKKKDLASSIARDAGNLPNTKRL